MDRTAEACRRSADEGRKVAYRARTATVRDTFQRLAHRYDVLAEQLEKIAERSTDGRDLTWLLSAPPLRRGRHLEH
jgi:hypothetical protein